jgi:beta-galactosidase
MFDLSRRQFLKIASLSTGGLLLRPPLRAADLEAASSEDGVVQNATRLESDWQYRRGALDGVHAAWASEQKSDWAEVSLPHCFNGLDACDPETPYYRGQGWYRTRISIHNPFAGGRTLLHFQGAGQDSTVWIGNTLVGSHKGGYDEFAFDITEAVAQLSAAERNDGIPLVICCDNSPDQNRVPSDLSDFCLYGGLYRHVNLVCLPAVALDAVHIRPTLAADGSAQVAVSARLYNPTGSASACTLSVEVLDAQGQAVHHASKSLIATAASAGFAPLSEFHLAVPKLWSPDTPHLYRCRVTLSTAAGQTRLEERFGIRHIEFVESGPFKLNGKRVLLRGTHRHADHAGVAAAMSDALVRREMQMIRDMGANFIRLAHYQQDRLVLDLCDELGLMVWEEVPWCRAGVGGEGFQQNAHEMLTHMIEQHYNHPSVILWGLGNEDDWPGEFPKVDQQAIRVFMTDLRDLAHRLDDSRLTSFRRCDFASDIPDVYSPSIWAGWYGGNYREYEQALQVERARVKRFIHIEWGADSHAGRHSEDPEAALSKVPLGRDTAERGLVYLKTGGEPRMSKNGDYSETYACLLFDWHLKTQEKLEWLTGSAQWAFKDFASPLRGDNPIPRVNQKGVVERDLTTKESYYVFQSFWAEKPMAHIYGHTWPVRWGKVDEKRTVHVYSNCERAELLLNGKSMGIKHRDSQDFPAAGLRWEVVFQRGSNHLSVIAIKGEIEVSDELHLIYQTEPWGDPVQLKLSEKARDKNLVTVEATLFDAEGILCVDSAKNIRFQLTGAGSLVDNLGTSRASRELQLSNGRAEISIVRRGGCKLAAMPEGMASASLNL